jgi:hypothetical protein
MNKVRIAAVFLISLGFLWLAAVPIFYKATSVARWSTYLETLPKKDVFEKEEIEMVIIDLGQQYSHSCPWVFTPAMAMLIGFLLYLKSLKNHSKAAEQGAAANP